MLVMRRLACFAASMKIGFALGGCCAALPTYEWQGHDAAMAHLVERSQRVHAVSATGHIRLRDRAGDRVTLDGAMVLRSPDHVRVRAWKFNQPVFDMTHTPDGQWLWSADEDRLAHLDSLDLARVWPLLNGTLFNDASPHSTIATSHVVACRDDGGAILLCEIDRRTLVPLRFDVVEDDAMVAQDD